jgi:hypothetical protein
MTIVLIIPEFDSWMGYSDISPDEIPALEKYGPQLRVSYIIFGLVSWIIAGAEKIIQYNALEPMTSLAAPGQSIPLIVGAMVAWDGVATCCRRKRRR